jgi:hypothetical protein
MPLACLPVESASGAKLIYKRHESSSVQSDNKMSLKDASADAILAELQRFVLLLDSIHASFISSDASPTPKIPHHKPSLQYIFTAVSFAGQKQSHAQSL